MCLWLTDWAFYTDILTCSRHKMTYKTENDALDKTVRDRQEILLSFTKIFVE